MMELLLHAAEHAFEDTIRLIPFLFVTYLVMEWLERKTQEKQTRMLAKVGRLGPIFGAAAGAVPQCGFSAAASSLYAGGILSIGTLLAVFLSTSDEMLPLLISSGTKISSIVMIVVCKALIGLVSGLAVDSILRFTKYRYKTEKRIHDLCEAEHCGCEDEESGILHAAFIHTLHIVLFVFVITFVLTAAVEGIGHDVLVNALSTRSVLSVFVSALIGLIPNCAASVTITQLYLDGMLGFGPMMAGLLVSAGVGLLVLFRTNAHLRENLRITALLYVIAVFWGLVLQFSGFAV